MVSTASVVAAATGSWVAPLVAAASIAAGAGLITAISHRKVQEATSIERAVEENRNLFGGSPLAERISKQDILDTLNHRLRQLNDSPRPRDGWSYSTLSLV